VTLTVLKVFLCGDVALSTLSIPPPEVQPGGTAFVTPRLECGHNSMAEVGYGLNKLTFEACFPELRPYSIYADADHGTPASAPDDAYLVIFRHETQEASLLRPCDLDPHRHVSSP
jgi:hypothetical protein